MEVRVGWSGEVEPGNQWRKIDVTCDKDDFWRIMQTYGMSHTQVEKLRLMSLSSSQVFQVLETEAELLVLVKAVQWSPADTSLLERRNVVLQRRSKLITELMASV